MDTNATPAVTTPNLRALQAIEHTGGITAAAAYLGVSGTSIDKHLAKLRMAFEDDLVVFTGRDTLITPLGTKLLGLVETLFETYDEISSLAAEPAAARARAGDRAASHGAPLPDGQTPARPLPGAASGTYRVRAERAALTSRPSDLSGTGMPSRDG